MANQAMAINPNDYTKEELAAGLLRLKKNATAKINKYQGRVKTVTEEVMRIALSSGAAFGVGWWMGQASKEPDFDPEEDLQWFGLDKEAWIGGVLVLASLTPWMPKGMTGAARAMGTGVLSYYAGVRGHEVGAKPE